VTTVDRIDTHCSSVFLAGDRAYKLKRAVKYDYLDFSTLDLRRKACEAEVSLNRRTAPGLYLGVLSITRQADGHLAIAGTGRPIEWVVHMVRFSQEALLDRVAAKRVLDLKLMPPLASAIARFHAGAKRRYDHGGRAGLDWVISGNAAGLAEHGAEILDGRGCERLHALARAALERHTNRLDARRAEGFVRVCHGDLHLRNIVLLDGHPTLFDAVEFNDRISCIDTLYDFAFLLMDLWRLGLVEHANVLFNEYMTKTDQVGALSLMPLFLSCRAAVRAKTSATAARLQRDSARANELRLAAREYLGWAERFLEPPGPRLIAIGGVSGSGKSVLARRLAPAVLPAPGALVLRSDVIRKSLFGVSAPSPLGPEGYTKTVTEHVYAALGNHAATALNAGHAVIVDAVFGDPSQRRAIAEVGQRFDVPFVGLWLDAPVDVLMERLRSRQADASDATVEILQQQLTRDVGALDWQRIDASGEPALVQERAETFLRQASAAVQ
jgi:aminoglycoside phosphotransferase family enzyme/predicted kinase